MLQTNGVDPRFSAPLDSHRTLWMGDLQSGWDAEFIANAYKEFGHEPSTVKMVTDKHTGQPSGYCFVEFAFSATAREAMLRANGTTIPGTNPPVRFNLSFANDPRVPSIEYNLFVNNLSKRIDDADLYQVFGRKYPSCRGAKVYRNSDGSSRGLGFVRFGSQTEQQQALVEMNNTVVMGHAIVLKLAAAKQRLPRNQIRNDRHPPRYMDNAAPSMVAPMQMVPVAPAPVAVELPPPVELIEYPTADEANAKIMEDGDSWWEMIEESRWSSPIIDTNWTDRDLQRAIVNARW